ncbi:hypothetical protein SAMN05660649_01292 [Desulfotomaculum arcticum]|uniref:Uncharacterized protein n=1 Tax=Desulfotruncus arcticus DSM 17038 TaxID=1121424 RepID=A0A1I2QM39_9FIRM|nr:hypothetical protein [Desulfotruncus arcticus]SFG29040.1 hypothetical protein SAMN05660649_01292 [Desulfotomaculum arcticum] [Desulfotruncus arcticus DSM 17038]
MPVKLLTIGFGLCIWVLSMLILPNSVAASGEEAVHAYNQHDLYYEWDYPNKSD